MWQGGEIGRGVGVAGWRNRQGVGVAGGRNRQGRWCVACARGEPYL